VVVSSQNGVTTKQARFVMIVTIKATASLPPARRVQTAADASVLGTLPATNRPIARSGRSVVATNQANNGNSPLLIAIPNITACGRRTACQINAISSGNAMKNIVADNKASRGKRRA
jgi:hypothetical protein